MAADNVLLLVCLLVMRDAPARPATVTSGALRNWLGGGRGMTPSAVIEPQPCLMTCLFCTVTIVK